MPHERPIAPYNSVIAVLDQVPGGILITEAATGKVSYGQCRCSRAPGHSPGTARRDSVVDHSTGVPCPAHAWSAGNPLAVCRGTRV